MSIMDQAKSRALVIERDRVKNSEAKRIAAGQALAMHINALPWMQGMPPAVYLGDKQYRMGGRDYWFSLFEVDDVTLGVKRAVTESDAYYIQVECHGGHPGCSVTTWADISQYATGKNLTEMVAEVLAQDTPHRCESCAAAHNGHRRCATCGKPE